MFQPPNPSERSTALRVRRDLKMARSVHAYVRGSTERFYEWVASPAGKLLPRGPDLWICGDCHVGNLGPIGHPAGRAIVELRDLDQTVIGNPAHDVVRLALSLSMSARSSDLPGVTTARIVEELVAGYERAFEGDAAPERIADLPEPIRLVMKQAVHRTWTHLFAERLGRDRRQIPLNRRFWPLADDERTAIQELVATEPMRKLVAQLASRQDDTIIKFVDAAFWVKGCSSLGLWRAAVLVQIKDASKKHKRRRRSLALIDIKQAIDPIAPWSIEPTAKLPNGERVHRGALALAPALGKRMLSARILDRSVFIRELLPQDLKVELDHISTEQGRAVAFYLGMVLGDAHGRQLDAAGRRTWREAMAARRTNIDAPNWLWKAVVQLVGLHEEAYLEHCREYALTADEVGPTSIAQPLAKTA